jgi:hypothetical protein
MMTGRFTMKKLLFLMGVLVLVTATATSVVGAQGEGSMGHGSGGLVRSIANAPIVPDGTVTGRPTDFVITFDTPLDPNVPGRTLLQGKTIKVTLPHEFQTTGKYQFLSAGSTPECGAAKVECNTGVVLQGWPQNPIRPPFLNYSIEYEEQTRTITLTALKDLVPDPPLEPGIKQIHLMLLDFVNPPPGEYRVSVVAETGPGGAVESEWGSLRILPKTRPSISVTSVFNGAPPRRPNTIYQETTPGALAPLPYDFLLWDRNGSPFEGAGIEAVNPGHSLLVQDDRVVGQVFIEAPEGATGYEVYAETSSWAVNAPLLGVPAGRLQAFFRAGSAPGEYAITFQLNGGNSVQMFVTVE